MRVTLTFSVASQTQTVEVSAVAEQINTENGTIAGSVQNQQLTELPLNSRALSTSPLAALARFESTFTNVLNHTNYAPPAVDVSNAQTFSVLQSNQSSANAGPRTGQLALRLDF